MLVALAVAVHNAWPR